MWLFLAIIGSLMFVADVLWWWRGDVWSRRLKAARWWRTAWTVFMLFQIGMVSVLMLGGRLGINRTEVIPKILLTFTFVWHLLVLPATLVLTGLIALLSMVAAAVRKWRGRPAREAAHDAGETPAPPNSNGAATLTRRQFLAAGAVAIPPLVTVIGTGVATNELRNFRVRPVTIALRSLPKHLDGLTIAQVCDVHVGDFTNGPLLDRIADATNRLKPDLALMPGDLINRRLSDLPAALDMVKKIDAKYGTYLCQGNHDLFENPQYFDDTVRAAGVTLLTDQMRSIPVNGGAVQILGLQWGSRGGDRDAAIDASMDRMIPQLDREAFPILMSHHPHAFDRAAAAGIPLTLAGHTHGGQLMLSHNLGFGPLMYRYWSGIYRKRDESRDAALFVSNGVGNWFPLRINAPAEIVHITLRRDA